MDPILGQISIFPFDFVPEHWARCEGQLLPIRENTALYSLLGNRFGGDNQNTFGLPNYKDKAPAGSAYFIALQGVYPRR